MGSINSNKIYLGTGHLFFICFLLGTIYYFAERLLNNDAAYYSFHVVNYESFFIKHERYISYFTQWLPILLAKAGCNLKTVLISYSAIFGIWFYGLYILIAHVWKSPKTGLLLVLALCLTMRYKHYAGHTEITFAIAVATTLFAWVIVPKDNLGWYSKKMDWLIKILFILWLYIIHPIIIIPLAMMLGIDIIVNKRWRNLDHLAFVLVLLLSFGVRFITVAKDSYESGKVSILSTGLEVFTNPEKYYVFHIVKRYFDKEYHIVFLFFMFCFVYLFLKKELLPAIGLFLGNLCILALVIVTYSYLKGDVLIMIDGYLGMMGMVIGYTIYLVADRIKKENIFAAAVALLVLFCTVRIQSKSKFMKQRLDYYAQTFRLYPENSKLYAPLKLHDWSKLWYPYEVPIESLMWSSMEGKMPSKTIYIDYDAKNIIEKFPQSDVLYLFDSPMSISRLNPKFFKLPNDEPYKKIDSVAWK